MPDRHILLVEDSENDIELTLGALAKDVANEVVVARDAAEALDSLQYRWQATRRSPSRRSAGSSLAHRGMT
jgi:CheY-like chemotaxis protein